MIDNHDSCEWVNVSSGTGSPICSGQSPESCKMVLVVVVTAHIAAEHELFNLFTR